MSDTPKTIEVIKPCPQCIEAGGYPDHPERYCAPHWDDHVGAEVITLTPEWLPPMEDRVVYEEPPEYSLPSSVRWCSGWRVWVGEKP